jgi:uncharacterized protein
MDSLSPAQARRVALAAQGFADPLPTGEPGRRHLRRVLGRIGLLQIDSVNVLQRAHYLPLYSRLGPYRTDLLDEAVYRRPRELFEYWGHEASLLPLRLHPLLRWRMADSHAWGGVARLAAERPDLIEWIRGEVSANGPLTAAQVEADVPRRTGNWGWNWSDAKRALEWLFWKGKVLVAGRNGSFARMYDIPSRVLPAEILAAPTPSPEEARRELIAISARALGVATEGDLRDYFRLPVAGFRTALHELVDAGELRPVEVDGWRQPGYLDPRARIPRWSRTRTLLSPFDPVVWRRERAERLFDFTYRIEIYVPAPQRLYGYYVLPFLLGDRLVARVDLKADRATGVLWIPAAWGEPGAPPETPIELAAELWRLAGWLGLSDVAAPERGDLARSLADGLRAGPV